MGEGQDLEEAISRMRTAVRIQSTKGEGSLLAIMFNNLGGLLFRRYGCAGRKEDQKEALSTTLTAAKMVSSDDTQLLAGISINLAILLVKTYEFTGKLEDLGNALFEARIAATGAASEMSELDILLRHLWGLARMQHSGRALGTTQTIPCSHSRHAKPFALALLILLPAIYGICPEAFLPTVAFLCGIGCNWAIDQWYRTGRAGGKPFHLGVH